MSKESPSNPPTATVPGAFSPKLIEMEVDAKIIEHGFCAITRMHWCPGAGMEHVRRVRRQAVGTLSRGVRAGIRQAGANGENPPP